MSGEKNNRTNKSQISKTGIAQHCVNNKNEIAQSEATQLSTAKSNMTYPIFVRGSDNRTLVCEVTASTTVVQLKEQIERRTYLPTREQRLIFQGKQLENSNCVSDYQICRDSTIHLTARLPGGGLGYIHLQPNLRQLAEKYKSDKLVCRECYARLPLRAKNCRKCHSNDLRKKHRIGEGCKI